MTISSKPAGIHYVLVFFMLVSVLCGAGWFQAHRHSEELSEQRIRDLEQRLAAAVDAKRDGVTPDEMSRAIAHLEQRLATLINPKRDGAASTDQSRDIANRVYAEVMISRYAPHMLSDRVRFESFEDFEYYRQMQAAMVKSPFVLASVLRNSEIANLSLLRDQAQPFKFLEDQLDVEFPAKVIMRISFNGPRSPDAVRIVNAVVTEYLNEVVNSENNARNNRILDLDKAHHVLEEKLRTRRTQLKKLVTNLQTGDREALTEKQKMMIELHSVLRKERAQKHLELMSLRIKLAALEDAAKSNEDAEIPEAVIEEQVAANPQIQRAQADIEHHQDAFDETTRHTDDATNARLLGAKQDLESAKKKLELLRTKVRRTVAEQLRTDATSKAQATKLQLRETMRVIELTIRQLDDEMEKQKVDTQQTGQWSLEIESLREDLEQVKNIDHRITEEIERLKLEQQAGSRVALYREADAEA